MSPLHKLIVRQIYQSCVTDFTLQGVLPGFLTSATWARQLWRVLFLCFLRHFSNRNIFMWKYQAWSFTKISKERAGDWTAGIPTWVEVSSKSGFFGWDLSNCDNCGWIEKQRQHSKYSEIFCLWNLGMLGQRKRWLKQGWNCYLVTCHVSLPIQGPASLSISRRPLSI